MTSSDLEKLGKGIFLMEKSLKSISKDLEKLTICSYSDMGKLNQLNHKNNKLTEYLSALRKAVAEGYVDVLFMYGELKNLEKDTETLQIETQEMITKYYSKYRLE